MEQPSTTASGEVLAPGKVLRLSAMVDAIVAELHAEPNSVTLARIRVMYRDALIEVGSTLSDPLLEELARLQPTVRVTSDDELRVDIVQLAGWLRGLRFGMAASEVPFELPPLPDPAAAQGFTGGQNRFAGSAERG